MGKPFFNRDTLAASLWDWYAKRGSRPWVAAIELRCKHYNALPFAGGVADQPEQLMSLLELVSVVKRYHDMGNDLSQLVQLPRHEAVWVDRIMGRNYFKENGGKG